MRVPPYLLWPMLAAVAYAVLWFIAQRVMFQPMKYPRGPWETQGEIGAEDVWIEAADGVRLHGWWLRVPDSTLVSLFLHGNAGNVSHRGLHMREIAYAGSSVLAVDYRGYGKSGGRPSEAGFYADAEAAWRYLLSQGYSSERVVVHGESIGTAVAVELAARVQPGGVILEAPFTSAGELAGRIVPLIGPLVVRGFCSDAKIGRVGAPLLVIHGEQDDVVDFALGRTLYEKALGPKEFWALPGAGHNNIVDAAGAEYGRRLRRFYNGLK